MLDNKVKCILCNREFDYNDQIEGHIVNDHMMSYSRYYDFYKSIGETKCSICNEGLIRLSPWFEIYNPCINCSGQRVYYDSVLMGIDKVHNLLCTNKYLKLFILNKELRERLTEFNLMDYCRSLAKMCKDDLGLVKITTEPGKSPYIDPSMKNVILLESEYEFTKEDLAIINNEKFKFNFNGNEYEIYLPEECEYHNNNHYKYNILNRSNNPQSAKKLLLSSGTCMKFYNTNFDACKSLLKVNKNGSGIYSISLSPEELECMKYYIMSNPSLLRYILNVLYEMMKYSMSVYDQAFLLNRIQINQSSKFDMVIDWTINNKMMDLGNKSLNISVL